MRTSGEGNRRTGGGAIDYGRRLGFVFNGRSLHGYKGDTLASALLANGISIVGRSFKYHRARGIFSAGVEEPNALVRIGEGAKVEPVARATDVELYDGLVARSLNAWPSARWDVSAAMDRIHRFLPAGFYYKTFKWPSWDIYSKVIRRLSGLAELPIAPDCDWYVKRNAWCDLLVVGSGPTGLAAALAAARAGQSVVLVEHQPALGGSTSWRPGLIKGKPQAEWAQGVIAELRRLPNVRTLTRTMAFGYYDHNLVAAIERITDHLEPRRRRGRPRQRLWKFRAKRVILATGAIERPMIFPDNDRPGVMLAGAVHEYLMRYGVLVGSKVIIFTENDSAYETALALREAGASVHVLDTRASIDPDIAEKIACAGISVRYRASILSLKGTPARRVGFAAGGGRKETLACDLLAVSAGWTPTVHLYSQAGGSLRFDEHLQTFIPDTCPQAVSAAGAAAGTFDLDGCVASGEAAAAGETFNASPRGEVLTPFAPFYTPTRPDRQWVDLHNDVTLADIELAGRENFVSVEHLKRYTTAGMAVDQGKTSNVNALLHLAAATGRSPQQVGTTKFRPPYAPISFGSLAGQVVGDRFHPLRRLPAHDLHVASGAVLTEMSGWWRPEYYPQPGESPLEATQREVLAVRTKVGLFDSSSLGKIEICGEDAAIFLDRLFCFRPSSMSVGEVRPSLALSDDGTIIDDSRIVRFDANRYLIITTTSAAPVMASAIESYLQLEWPDLLTFCTPVTTQWAMLSLAGPRSSALLAQADPSVPLERLQPMSAWQGELCGIVARILRISYSGELAFEIMVPARSGAALWECLRAAGDAFELEPFGLEALDTLRIEKGFAHVGVETDRTTMGSDILPRVLGSEEDYVGRRSTSLEKSLKSERLQLVGLLSEDRATLLPTGAEISRNWNHASEGHVTSSVHSPTLGHPIALAMLRDGRQRQGERLTLQHGDATFVALVTDPCFYDPEGKRS